MVEIRTPSPRRRRQRERVVLVDSPPSPRTSPQAPLSPSWSVPVPRSPAYVVDAAPRGRQSVFIDGRPIVINERRARAPSVDAVFSDRPARHRGRSRSRSVPRVRISSASRSRSRLRRCEEREEDERRQRQADLAAQEAEAGAAVAALELAQAERRRAERRAAHDEEIRRRPAVPPAPLYRRPYLHPVVDQSEVLQNMMGSVNLNDRMDARNLSRSAPERRRVQFAVDREIRDDRVRAGVDAVDTEAMRQRLRDRQLPRRSYTVGHGRTARPRHRVTYDDGRWRWE